MKYAIYISLKETCYASERWSKRKGKMVPRKKIPDPDGSYLCISRTPTGKKWYSHYEHWWDGNVFDTLAEAKAFLQDYIDGFDSPECFHHYLHGEVIAISDAEVAEFHAKHPDKTLQSCYMVREDGKDLPRKLSAQELRYILNLEINPQQEKNHVE